MQLEGCSNPGLSFTYERKTQILEFYEWVNQNVDYEKTYKQIQADIEINCNHLDGSKVRMIVPFLRKMGYISKESEEKNILIKLEEFLTKDGKVFGEYLRLWDKISQIEDEKVLYEMKTINELFSTLSMLNLISNGEYLHLDIIKFLNKYDTMDKYEFFIMTTFQNLYDRKGKEYTNQLDNYITKYRNKEISEIEIVKHENSFGYIKSFLLETNLVTEEKINKNKKILKLNKNHKYIEYFINMEG